MEMGNIKDDDSPATPPPFLNFDVDVDDVIKLRQEAYTRKAKENIDSELKAIKINGKTSSSHDPLYPSRPYGLAGEMEGFRRHVWDLILVHVNDLDTIVSLCDVCRMFKDLLERKNVGARLPEIIGHCLERNVIPWTQGTRIRVSNWVKTLSSLRTISKATQISVDAIFSRGMLAEEEWFWIFYPHFRMEYWKIPTYMFGALDGEQVSLQRTLDSLEENSGTCWPINALIFNEWRADRVAVDLQSIRSALQKCLEKVGCSITSFRYTTIDTPLNAYNNLRRFVAHLPNLKELIVTFTGPRATTFYKNVGAFPKCEKLKRYVEGPHGFGVPFINEIVKANPTIQEVLLGKTPSSNLEVKNLISKVLDTLDLTMFHCTCTPTVKFLEHRFRWNVQLTTLAFWDTTATTTTAVDEIPSDKMFGFISSCKNLKNLLVMSSRVRDTETGTGPFLESPMMETLYWKITPEFMSLEFMKPLESLEWLALDMSSCPVELHPVEKVMEFLEEWHVPSLFPALKSILVKTERNGNNYKKIWKSSA